MSDPLSTLRQQFPILSRKTYLLSHSLGAMPATVRRRMAEYCDSWEEFGAGAWEKGWWRMPLTVGDEIAPLMGAGVGEVAMLPNVTVAQSIVLSAIPITARRNRIIMTELDFPSVRYAFEALAQRFGAEIDVIPSDDGIHIDEERIMDAISDRTALVAISHVLFRSACILDVASICAKAHEAGALVSLDSFHAVGAIPVDIHTLGADFLTGGVLKWLCGGPGGCFLYAAPSVRGRLSPSVTGWQAHSRPFEFEGEMDYAAGMERWLTGTPGIPALYAAAEGVKIMKEIGMDAIRAKSMRQTNTIVERADARGFQVNSPRDASRRGGTVSIMTPRVQSVYRHLLARDVMIDYRPAAGIRIAPHFYTSDDELDRVFTEIDVALRAQAPRSTD